MTRVWIWKPLIAEVGKGHPQPTHQGTKLRWSHSGKPVQAATQEGK
jgi:hypothetical protein